MGFLWQEYWNGFPSPLTVGHVLSELSMTRLPWVALHGMTHSFIELHKPLHLDKPIIHEGVVDYTKAFDCVDHNKLWKIFQEVGMPDHLTCLLRNLCAGQEATVRTRHGTVDWFQIGKGVWQGCILSPCLFNFYAKYIMQNATLDES